ncbi:MAG: glycosyltransferase family 2 protein [Chitinophagaceae bacterium]|nr:MAG: glycosyltransferase family 2 protein [Chitinophagaceae bacterium]
MNSSDPSADKVLLICPVRNEAAYIPRLLNSLQQQTHSNWIIHFFNNASTDETVQIVSQALKNDSRIKLQTFAVPVPINENFNRAIQIAVSSHSARFIGFIGGDDMFLEETYLEDLVFVLSQGSSIAIPMFKIQEEKEIDSYFTSFNHLNRMPIINRIMQGWDSNYGNILYSLFTWSDFLVIISDERSRLSSNLSSDWWFINTALRVIGNPPRFVPSATYIKFNKRYGYDSEYYHVDASHSKNIGLQVKPDSNLGQVRATLWQRVIIRIENILVVPTLIIFREWRRIHLRNFPEFILVWNVMVATRLRLAIRTYFKKKISR